MMERNKAPKQIYPKEVVVARLKLAQVAPCRAPRKRKGGKKGGKEEVRKCRATY